MIGFMWPWMLGLLLLLPLLVWLYRRAMTPPAESVALHPDVALLARAASRRRRWTAHVAASLYLAACGLALAAMARPTIPVPRVNERAGIVLAIDLSRSMAANDITPSRFEAARQALKTFVRALPGGARVGVVAFSSYAATIVPLTADHQQVLDAVDLLTLGRSTAIGDGIMKAIQDLPSLAEREKDGGDPSKLATIVLLSDGRNRTGVDPLAAAAEAKKQHIVVDTVGVGTDQPGGLNGGFNQFGAAGRFDERTLRSIAGETGGTYVFVDSATKLNSVYRRLGRSTAWSWHKEEASGLVALAAAGFLLLSMLMGQARRRVL
ncbi:MAG TPA: VWA domain-containing protein [Trueperaceae bacterium]|nr:VWA domain-containing protein [Trueperaceae bacterium]